MFRRRPLTGRPMPALGHKRTYAVQNGMSALPPIATAKADISPGSCPLYPQSGHVRCNEGCLLWANSGHSTIHSITSQPRGCFFSRTDNSINGPSAC